MVSGAMKSLFRSRARSIKERFTDKDEDTLATPLGLRLGAAVDIDTLPLRMHADELHIDLPEETKLIVAQGFVDLGDDTYVHRFYAADDTMIQVLTAHGVEDEHIEEVTLYVPYESFYPSTPEEWERWTGRGGKLGAPSYRLDDETVYNRIWFDDFDGHVDPVEFTENVYDDPEADEARAIYQKVMLFGRNLEAGKKNEYLLLAAESYDGETTVELMVGADLEITGLKV
ncbi:MAG: DUF2491 family protein, partial [Hyphomicrobium sp.]